MASSALPALALKAAAVAAVLVMPVMPSLGRCPSLGPEPLPAVPPPAPAPGPAMSCSDCNARCAPTCEEYVAAACSSYCTPPSSVDCDGCSNGSVHGEQCRQCYDQTQQCPYCMRSSNVQCNDDCHSNCYATGVCA